ncbi:MAG: matrixin family metalloprotease [bacterium]
MTVLRPSARFWIACAIALVPLASGRVPRVSPRTSVASGGTISRLFESRGPDDPPDRATRRKRLAAGARGTYIADMLAERDSSLARWPSRTEPLTVWIQPSSVVAGWSDTYVDEVRDAFEQWNVVRLPVRFAFTSDSAAADVHVSFINRFDEEISGRTTWSRDDEWWITNADIVLAVFHRNGPRLDDDAMHAMSLHEIGHLLGLDHTTDNTSIMASRVRVRTLSAADRATVRLLYTLPPGGVR